MDETGINGDIPPSRAREMVLNADTIGKIRIPQYRRSLSDASVSKIEKELLQGAKLHSAIAINNANGKLELIDGNHRIEAVKKVLEKNPSFSMRVPALMYENLSVEQAERVYHYLNDARKETVCDYVQKHEGSISILKMMKQSFQFEYSLRGGKHSMSIVNVLRAYLGALYEKEPISYNHKTHDKLDVIEKMKQLDRNDYDVLNEFCRGFVSYFGAPSRENIYRRTSIFNTIMRIYVDNCVYGEIQERLFWKSIKSKMIPYAILTNAGKDHSRNTMIHYHDALMRELNTVQSHTFYYVGCKFDKKTGARVSLDKLQKRAIGKTTHY